MATETGTAGDNSFFLIFGVLNYVIDGLGGVDTAFVSWPRRGFNISSPDVNRVTTISSASGGGESIRLSNVEFIQFSDFRYAVPQPVDPGPVNNAPAGEVIISGIATLRQTLVASNSLSDADGLGSISYQWQADGADIAGATASTLVLAEAQVGKAITVSASYVDGRGNAERKTSLATAAVARAFDPAGGGTNLVGGNGSDILADPGGTGVMAGGRGDDTYMVEREDQRLTENPNEGSDGVITTLAAYTLGDNVERLQAKGQGAFRGTGNARANSIEGNIGNDILDGGEGADRLSGGAGDDTYLIDHIGDRVVEQEGEGKDTVNTRLNAYSLAAAPNVEILGFTGSGDFRGSGNSQDNTLTGGDGNDRLFGLKGDDLLVPGAGADTVDGGEGSDTAQMGGNRADYVFSRLTQKDIRVVRRNGGETDVLSNIEQLRFADGSSGVLTLDDLLKNTASNLDDKYEGSPQDDSFDGLAGNDRIDGLGGKDTLVGGPGNDTLDGGAGADSLAGGPGNDSYVVDTGAALLADGTPVSGDTVVELADQGFDLVQTSLAAYTLPAHVENLVFTAKPGTPGAPAESFSGSGNDQANTISGGGGNDSLDGGKGGDRLIGGAGDDIYVVDHRADKVVEKAGEGRDTIRTNLISFGLVGIANVENLSFSGGGRFSGGGNELDNVLSGNGGDDILDGGKGDDSLAGGAGNDLLRGGEGQDSAVLAGNRADYVFSRPDAGRVRVARKDGSESDILVAIEQVRFADGSSGRLSVDELLKNTASALDDNYEGDAEANAFDGLAGNDLLLGGGGNDSLAGGSGNDTLDGGSGADSLAGGSGNDSYVVDNRDDRPLENAGEGNDTVRTALVSWTLADNLELLVFTGSADASGVTAGFAGTGNERANTLSGGDGNDSLDGGAGADRLLGGAGDDTYIVDRAPSSTSDAAGNSVTLPGDQTIEAENAGIDTVRAGTAGWTLASNVENLVAEGGGGLRGTGNLLPNRITGNVGNDRLFGLDGADTLAGGGGRDTLTGGSGSDSFVFDSLDTPDIIVDFVGTAASAAAQAKGIDRILLTQALFKELSWSNGALADGQFQSVTDSGQATAGMRLVYRATTGDLFYDADGFGTGDAEVLLASFGAGIHPALLAADFAGL